MTPADTVLMALSVEPRTAEEIAAETGLPLVAATEALVRLRDAHLAIPEDGKYELTGPLSWFGTFRGAVDYFARRRFWVEDKSDGAAHLYLTDVRVKGGRPAGDPLTETVAIFACGKGAQNIRSAPQYPESRCEVCLAAYA